MTTEASICPVVVSQETCLAAYGVTPRWYLDRANAGAFPSKRAGKLVLSRPADFLAYLQSLPGAAAPAEARATERDVTTAHAAATAAGLRWVG